MYKLKQRGCVWRGAERERQQEFEGEGRGGERQEGRVWPLVSVKDNKDGLKRV